MKETKEEKELALLLAEREDLLLKCVNDEDLNDRIRALEKKIRESKSN